MIGLFGSVWIYFSLWWFSSFPDIIIPHRLSLFTFFFFLVLLQRSCNSSSFHLSTQQVCCWRQKHGVSKSCDKSGEYPGQLNSTLNSGLNKPEISNLERLFSCHLHCHFWVLIVLGNGLIMQLTQKALQGQVSNLHAYLLWLCMSIINLCSFKYP